MSTSRSSQRPPFVESLKKAAFVIGSAIIVLTAARNTIVWYVQRFWGASGSFWQNLADNAYDSFGNEDANIAINGTLIVTNCFFWFLSMLLVVLDLTGFPRFLMKYKIQPDKNAPLEWRPLLKAILLVGFNSSFIGYITIRGCYHVMKFRGCVFKGDLPTFQWVLLEMVVFILVEEFGFYYTHRLFHSKFFYKRIHKLHHEWTAPIGLVAIYAHPVEHILSNMLPVLLGPILMGSHILVTWTWFCLALLSTVNSHSGYHFPFCPSPEAHDFHHLKFINNFGVLGVLDRLHGTDNLFRKSKAYDRHLMMLSLAPPRETFPDDTKGKCQ